MDKLQWPAGWPRTPKSRKETGARFTRFGKPVPYDYAYNTLIASCVCSAPVKLLSPSSATATTRRCGLLPPQEYADGHGHRSLQHKGSEYSFPHFGDRSHASTRASRRQCYGGPRNGWLYRTATAAIITGAIMLGSAWDRARRAVRRNRAGLSGAGAQASPRQGRLRCAMAQLNAARSKALGQ